MWLVCLSVYLLDVCVVGMSECIPARCVCVWLVCLSVYLLDVCVWLVCLSVYLTNVCVWYASLKLPWCSGKRNT